MHDVPNLDFKNNKKNYFYNNKEIKSNIKEAVKAMGKPSTMLNS